MTLPIRIMAAAEMAVGLMVASLLLVDHLEIAGPDSAITLILGLSCLAVAAISILCFVFCLPLSIRRLISSPSERTVLQILVVVLAVLLTLSLAAWLIHISPYLNRRA